MVVLCGDASGDIISTAFLPFFMALPSIEYIKAQTLDLDHDRTSPLKQGNSNVQELGLADFSRSSGNTDSADN